MANLLADRGVGRVGVDLGQAEVEDLHPLAGWRLGIGYDEDVLRLTVSFEGESARIRPRCLGSVCGQIRGSRPILDGNLPAGDLSQTGGLGAPSAVPTSVESPCPYLTRSLSLSHRGLNYTA